MPGRMSSYRTTHRLPLLLVLGASLLAANPAAAKANIFSNIVSFFRPGRDSRQRVNRSEQRAMDRGGKPRAILDRLESRARAGKGLAAALLPQKILAGYKTKKFTIVAFDQGGSAQRPEDRASKFVVIQSIGGQNHLLGIPTPTRSGGGRENVSWLHRVKPDKAAHLGRMVRGTLEALASRVPGQPTEAFVNMPGGALTVGTLHVHGVARRKASSRDWAAFERQQGNDRVPKTLPGNGYQLYRTRDGFVALASKEAGAPNKLGAAGDKLVGQMFIDASRAAIAAGVTGQIAMSRSSDRIAVEVRPLRSRHRHRGGGFSLRRLLGL